MTDQLVIAGTILDPKVLPSWDRAKLSPAEAAYDGQIGVGSVAVRDTGSYSVYSGRRITFQTAGGSDKLLKEDGGALLLETGDHILLDETATVIFDGFRGMLTRTRPDDDALKRLNTYAWQDNNLLLTRRRVAGWSRPAELDRDRVLAAMATFCPLVDTSTYVPNTNTVMLPAKDYTDTDLLEVFADASDMSAKTYFVDRDRKLHYHLLEENVGFNASISITDSGADGVSSFAPSRPTYTGDPYDLANDLLITGATTSVVDVNDSTSQTNHDADGLLHQDIENDPDSDDNTDLTNLGTAALATRANDRETYRLTLENLPAPTLQAGMLITVTSSVLGLSSQAIRIAGTQWQTPAPGVWSVELDLGSPPRVPGELREQKRSTTVPSPGTVDLGAFGDGVRPIAILSSLPSLPDDNYPIGAVIFLTADGKLYRNVAGAWSRDADGADIIAGSITTSQIAAGAITAALIDVTQLDAITANMGTLTAGLIHDAANRIFLDLTNQYLRVNDGTRDRVIAGAIGGGDFGLKVSNGSGTVIIDGTSDIFKIYATGTLTISLTGRTDNQTSVTLSGLGTLATPGVIIALMSYSSVSAADAAAAGTTRWPVEPQLLGDQYWMAGSSGGATNQQFVFLHQAAHAAMGTALDGSSHQFVIMTAALNIASSTYYYYGRYYVLAETAL